MTRWCLEVNVNDGLRIKDEGCSLPGLFILCGVEDWKTQLCDSMARILRAESRCIESEILERCEEEFQSADVGKRIDLDMIQTSKRTDLMVSFIFYGSVRRGKHAQHFRQVYRFVFPL